MLYMYVANVLSGCCMCLEWLSNVFQVFCKCFKRMLQVFQLFRMYIANVLSGCCKSRSGVAVGHTCRSRLLQLLGHCRADANGTRVHEHGNRRGAWAVPVCRHAAWVGWVVRHAQAPSWSRESGCGMGNGAWESERGCVTRCRRGHPDVDVCLDIQVLATPSDGCRMGIKGGLK
jgi:hypothetical protein